MVRPYALAILILLGQCRGLIAQTHTSPMLEIHINAPKWANGCLDLTIERVNTSSQSIYLPEWEGLLILLSTKRIHDDHDPNKKDEDVWLPIRGLSDIVTFDAQPLAAGSGTIDHFCLPETSAVVNRQRETRRQVAVRGRIRIVGGYFPTEEEWRAYKAQREQMLDLPHEKWPTALLRPREASSEMLLPCLPQSECVADCRASPLISEGEQIIVPDVYEFHKDWNDRGKTLAVALDRLYSACRK
jgi:hypothetical protein